VVLERHEGRAIAMIEDNGDGFEPDAAIPSGQLGLIGMRERVALLAGTLEIESNPGEGTTVIARVPIPPPASLFG
jgi:signal transduction histidine kinase